MPISTLYETAELALGYMQCRPALHGPIVQKIKEELSLDALVSWALDLGCGSGLSAAPLTGLARRFIALDPAFPMLPCCRQTTPEAKLVQGVAEKLPFASNSFELITAAGSLNYADLKEACAEISRVLRPEGILAVYDFSPGRSFRYSDRLDQWFAGFAERYPPAKDSWREINPEVLTGEASGLKLLSFRPFEMELAYDWFSYANYLMTETSVVEAIHRGEPDKKIRNWLEESLQEVFFEQQERVVFRGYIAYLTRSDDFSKTTHGT
jgi:ubiquinone/menaquinone biosynthesis C-methylase UbiE